MVKEYHSEFLHVVIDCKTGNEYMDKAIESSISGYVHLVIHTIQTGQMGVLIDKTRDIAEEFHKQKIDKK